MSSKFSLGFISFIVLAGCSATPRAGTSTGASGDTAGRSIVFTCARSDGREIFAACPARDSDGNRLDYVTTQAINPGGDACHTRNGSSEQGIDCYYENRIGFDEIASFDTARPDSDEAVVWTQAAVAFGCNRTDGRHVYVACPLADEAGRALNVAETAALTGSSCKTVNGSDAQGVLCSYAGRDALVLRAGFDTSLPTDTPLASELP
jgi:hypothetical protein